VDQASVFISPRGRVAGTNYLKSGERCIKIARSTAKAKEVLVSETYLALGKYRLALSVKKFDGENFLHFPIHVTQIRYQPPPSFIPFRNTPLRVRITSEEPKNLSSSSGQIRWKHGYLIFSVPHVYDLRAGISLEYTRLRKGGRLFLQDCHGVVDRIPFFWIPVPLLHRGTDLGSSEAVCNT
jgi:hypothetical protein